MKSTRGGILLRMSVVIFRIGLSITILDLGGEPYPVGAFVEIIF